MTSHNQQPQPLTVVLPAALVVRLELERRHHPGRVLALSPTEVVVELLSEALDRRTLDRAVDGQGRPVLGMAARLLEDALDRKGMNEGDCLEFVRLCQVARESAWGAT